MVARTELLKTSENPTIADASIKPNITSQIPSGAPEVNTKVTPYQAQTMLMLCPLIIFGSLLCP